MTNMTDIFIDNFVGRTRSDLKAIVFFTRLVKEYWLDNPPVSMYLNRLKLNRLTDTSVYIATLLKSDD